MDFHQNCNTVFVCAKQEKPIFTAMSKGKNQCHDYNAASQLLNNNGDFEIISQVKELEPFQYAELLNPDNLESLIEVNNSTIHNNVSIADRSFSDNSFLSF